MYFPIWVFLIVISLGISIAAFIWGVRSGQFSDPERARYLPFTEKGPVFVLVKNPRRVNKEVYTLIVALVIGMAILMVPIGLTVYYQISR